MTSTVQVPPLFREQLEWIWGRTVFYAVYQVEGSRIDFGLESPYQWTWGAANAGTLFNFRGLHFRGDGGDAMRQEGGRSGRAGRNMPCDGLQDGTTPNVPDCRHRGWKAIRGHISEGLGCVCVAGPHIQAYQSLGYIRGTLSERHKEGHVSLLFIISPFFHLCHSLCCPLYASLL